MTDVNIAKTNIKVSLFMAASFLCGSYVMAFKAGEIYKDFTHRMQKYDSYESEIARHEAADSAIHATIFRRLARGNQ